MASSKVLTSTSPPENHHLSTSKTTFGSMNMDDILDNIYSDPYPFADSPSAADGGDCSHSVDDVWNAVDGGGGDGRRGEDGISMTLEDFLTKAGDVDEEDVRASVDPPPHAVAETVSGGLEVESVVEVAGGCEIPVIVQSEPLLGFDGGGRGKRRADLVEEMSMGKTMDRKQRRMIKNRESAMRSRERKQAYTIELESRVSQLEEENARLLREEVEQRKERLKKLTKNLVPVSDKPRPPKALRRVHSVSW